MNLNALKLIIKEILAEAKLNTKPVYVYHISYNANLREPLTGVYSRKFQKKGLFVAPLNAIKRSWAEWAASKGRFGAKHDQTYENLTLYKLALPKWVLDQANKEHHATAQKSIEANPETAIGAWGWDIETFIPEELLQNLSIAGSKTGKAEEFFYDKDEKEKHRKGQRIKHEVQTSIGPKGTPKRDVITYGDEPTSLEDVLKATDDSLKLLNKKELENVVNKLEHFLSPDWIKEKIKEYERQRKIDKLDLDYDPYRRMHQEEKASKERSENKEAAERKLSIARNLLEKK